MMKQLGGLTLVVVLILSLAVAGCCKKKPAAETAALPTTTVAQAPEVQESAPPPSAVKESLLEQQAKKEGALHTVYFEFDKYNIMPGEKAKLDKTAEWMTKNPNVKILVEGHCDERGTNEYNLALGERRASSAVKYLTNLGISADRISTISYGEERPADPGHDEAAWVKNRRDEFRIPEM